MVARYESTMPLITEVAAVREVGDKAKEEGIPAVVVLETTHVEDIKAEVDMVGSNNTHRAVALAVSRVVVQTPSHKASNRIASFLQVGTSGFILKTRVLCHQPYSRHQFATVGIYAA